MNKLKAVAFCVSMAFGVVAHAQQESATKNSGAQKTTSTVVAHAQQKGTLSPEELKAAEDKLKATFPQFNVTSFEPSPLPGLFEIQSGANIVYFAPETAEHEGILFLGELYNKNGESLTEKSKDRVLGRTLKTLDLSSVIDIGNQKSPSFIEITDPDCPYCHAYDDWLKDVNKDNTLHRKLIFMVNPGHPLARAKIAHIICAKDKDEAVKYAYSSALPHENLESATTEQAENYKKLQSCPEADATIAEHQKLIQKLGVNGTPSFIFGADTEHPVKIVGFIKDKILEQLLKIKPAVKQETTTSAN